MATLDHRAVAIFPWGDVIEEFLDPLGLDAEDYARRMRGGWLFGYVAALQRHGRRAVIIHATERRRRPERLVHAETGAAIWLVPGRRSGQGAAQGRPSVRAALQWARTPFRGFARALAREGCDSLLVQDYEHARFDALAALAGALRLPLDATFQGGDVTLSPLEARIRGASLRRCRSLIVPSARERSRLSARYRLAPARMHDIPNPVDASLWRAGPRDAARQALGVAPGAVLALNHGRIGIHRKGLDVLIAAWKRAAAAHPAARLVLLGSGQDRDAFARLVADLPSVDWRSTYVTDPPLIRRWLSAADLYVTLSRTEGMPVAPLEAMACGLPVVASDAHGLADIFRGGEAAGGLVVPRGSIEGAAQALAALLADPARRQRLGRAAREAVEARYGLEPVGRALAALLSGAASRPRGLTRAAPAPAGA
ncbi:glycosyltransferase family 4 protein [Phenylobacterium sp.]|uniref:glycosyltransferase family 4 protein n=1 Tax=Phenylobacterium sp. TaxID=1871053 RepID=UPI002C8FCEC9|nr:glycosyltransferase [Phenylobacterium sp.]HVI30655.1 glycosyltransferase [Phenylobacterium sp.]